MYKEGSVFMYDINKIVSTIKQTKNSTPDGIRSAIISKVYAMSDEQAKKLLDLLESLVSE